MKKLPDDIKKELEEFGNAIDNLGINPVVNLYLIIQERVEEYLANTLSDDNIVFEDIYVRYHKGLWETFLRTYSSNEWDYYIPDLVFGLKLRKRGTP